MIFRNVTYSILDAVQDSPVILVNGARQTGKSTLVNWIAENKYPAKYFSLDDVTVFNAVHADPVSFLSNFEEPVIIDEVQKIPEIFNSIKYLVDKKRKNGRFILTGSANVLMLPRLSESLAGRMEIISLMPFSQGELAQLKENFIDIIFSDGKLKTGNPNTERELVKKILIGGYPEANTRTLPERRKAWFGSYLTTILQRDVRDISNVEGLTALPRLLSLLAGRTGSLLNFAELSRTSSIPQTTLKRYVALLEMTFQIYFLPAWFSNFDKRLVKAPKLYLGDTGLLSSLIGIDEDRLISDKNLFGHIFENFVVSELLKQINWSKTKPGIFHFRNASGYEVDVVMENAKGSLVGIEIKAAGKLTENDFKGLKILEENSKQKFIKGIIIYLGKEIIPFGKKMSAVPVNCIWDNGEKNG